MSPKRRAHYGVRWQAKRDTALACTPEKRAKRHLRVLWKSGQSGVALRFLWRLLHGAFAFQTHRSTSHRTPNFGAASAGRERWNFFLSTIHFQPSTSSTRAKAVWRCAFCGGSCTELLPFRRTAPLPTALQTLAQLRRGVSAEFSFSQPSTFNHQPLQQGPKRCGAALSVAALEQSFCLSGAPLHFPPHSKLWHRSGGA